MSERLKIMSPFTGWKKAWLLIFGVLFLSFIPGTSYAQCGFDTIGDYTCNQPTGGGGGGGGPIIGGGGQYSVEDYILTMPDAPDCSVLSQLPIIMPLLPASIQNALNAQTLGFLSGGASCDQIASYLANLVILQGILDGLPADPCGAGPDATGNDVTQEAVTALIYNSIAQQLAMGGSLSAVDVTSTVAEACTGAEPPCAGGGAAGGGGGGGGGGSCTPVNSATIEDDIVEHLKLREGVRSCAYQDSLGKWTIGVGHLIKDSDPYPRSTSTCISDTEVDTLLRSDMAWAQSAAQSQMAELGLNCHDFLVDLVSVNYQLGSGWRSKFPTTWSLMRQGQYSEAADGLESSLWNQQTPVRVDDFQEGLRQLDGVTPSAPPASCPGGGGGGDDGGGGGDDSQPGADALGRWCPDANAAGYATDTSLPGSYNLSETDPGRKIAESAQLAMGSTTADWDVTEGGALGCALAVSRILRCAGYSDVGITAGTGALYADMSGNSCYEIVDEGAIGDADLQPGDVLVTARNEATGRAGHTGIYVGDGQIISNTSRGFQGSAPGTVTQNYSVEEWDSGGSAVTSRNLAMSRVFRRTCP